MLNNFRYLVVTFIVAMILTMGGVLMEAMHVPGGPLLVSTMLMAQAATLVWMIVLLVRKRR